MKKFLSVLLCLMLTLFCCGTVSAQTTTEKNTVYTFGDYNYIILPDGTAEICSYRGKSTELTIPSTLAGYTVTSIGTAAFRFNNILVSVTLPNSVTHIDDFAFQSCYQLSAIVLPNSLTSIGMNAFGYGSLTGIIVSPDHPTLATIDGVLFDKQTKTLLHYPYVYSLTDTSYSVPEGILSIGEGAFLFSDLQSISLPDSLISIEEGAFSSCTKLTTLNLPNSLTTIGDSAFNNCYNLKDISFPESLTTIGNNAFAYCDLLTELTLPESLTTIGEKAFYSCSSLTNVSLPDSLVSIGKDAFNSCDELTFIVNYGSFSESYAKDNHFPFAYSRRTTSTDWLNN